MGITGHDLYLIAPELSLIGVAFLAVLLNLTVRRKEVLAPVTIVGLAVPFVFGLLLWNDIGASAAGAETAFNGALVVDKFALFFKLLLLGALALLLLASNEYVSRFRLPAGEFFGLVLLSTTGLMLLGASADLITVFVSLELASLPVVALAAFSKGQLRSVEAGLKYLLLAAISSAVLLYGFAFIYAATGTVRLMSLDPAVPTIATMLTSDESTLPFGSFALLAGVVLAVAGLGFKLSMVPFQMWTPDVYEGAPTPVAAFLAVASKAAALAVVLRLFYMALGPVSTDWALLFAVLAAVTMTVGNLVAITQTNLKRLLGYSTIAHGGYMLIGVAAVAARSQEAATAGLGASSVLFYLGGYAAMNLAAFFAVISIVNRTGDERISGLTGLGKRSPWVAGVLAFALVSLIGIPPTVGFMGKLFLFNAAVNADLAWLALIGLINSVISAYYYLNIIRVMYLRPPESEERIGTGAPERLALAATAVGILVLGVWPGGLLDVARTAAESIVP